MGRGSRGLSGGEGVAGVGEGVCDDILRLRCGRKDILRAQLEMPGGSLLCLHVVDHKAVRCSTRDRVRIGPGEEVEVEGAMGH